MADMVTLNISEKMLNPVIEEQVKLMMAEMLGGKDEIVNKVITTILKTKVDENGKPSSYSSSKTFIEWLLLDEVKKLVRELIEEELRSRTGEIKAAIKKKLQSEKGGSIVADALLNGLNDTFKYGWRSNIQVSFEPPSRD